MCDILLELVSSESKRIRFKVIQTGSIHILLLRTRLLSTVMTCLYVYTSFQPDFRVCEECV